MKSLKKFKVFSTVFAFAVWAVACVSGVLFVSKANATFVTKVVFDCYLVFIVSGLLAIIVPSIITAFSKGVALEESGLLVGQEIFLIDYAHNRVLSYIVKFAYIEGKTIMVKAYSSSRRDHVVYVPLIDVFLTEASAVERNEEFVRSQLEAVEEYLGVALNESGKEHFRSEFRKVFPNTIVFTYPHEWDIDLYIDSVVSNMSKRELVKARIFDKGYVKA